MDTTEGLAPGDEDGAPVYRGSDRTLPLVRGPARGSESMDNGARGGLVADHLPRIQDPPYGDDWHIEGNWFRHRVSLPEQALVNLFCFSTVEPGGGGTLLVEGSHHLAARILWNAEPDGLEADDFDGPLAAILDQKDWPGVVEVVAAEGDVVLVHPLMFHASNPNHGSHPRVMAQPSFSMTEPKRTEGHDLFPIEIPLATARP